MIIVNPFQNDQDHQNTCQKSLSSGDIIFILSSKFYEQNKFQQMKNLSIRLPKRFYISLSSIAIFLFVVSMGCNQGPPKNSLIAQANDGKALFEKQCVSCHGGEGVEADKALVDTLAALPPDLTRINKRRGVRDFPIAEIARFIDGRILVAAHGPREMPVWGQVYEESGLNESEIKGEKGKLIAYLMRIQTMD